MPPGSDGICMGVDQRNHQLAPVLPHGWIVHLVWAQEGDRAHRAQQQSRNCVPNTSNNTYKPQRAPHRTLRGSFLKSVIELLLKKRAKSHQGWTRQIGRPGLTPLGGVSRKGGSCTWSGHKKATAHTAQSTDTCVGSQVWMQCVLSLLIKV